MHTQMECYLEQLVSPLGVRVSYPLRANNSGEHTHAHKHTHTHTHTNKQPKTIVTHTHTHTHTYAQI
jgi:hypothetical protein